MREAETGNLSGVIRADWEFHRSIYRHCGNTQLLEIIEDLWRRIRQARSVARRDEAWGTGWARRSIARHDRLVEAIRAADSDEAAGITRLNIQESAAELIAKLRQLGWE
jgi:DNA-binding GntR family transcriptional regulator